MKDWDRIRELEERLASEEHRFEELERLEQELLRNISRQGFGDAYTEIRYRSEKEAPVGIDLEA